jgi:voltage-gated potassium channel
VNRDLRVLIFGADALAQEVAGQLTERGLRVPMFSSDQEKVRGLCERGFDARELDYTDDDQLRSVGLGSGIDIIFGLFDEESKNVFLTLSARALEPELKIVCVVESARGKEKMLAAGASKVLDPFEISGRKIHDLIARPMIVEMLDRTLFGKYMDIAEIKIPAGSCLAGRPLSQIELHRRYDVILIGVVDLEMGERLIFSTSGVDHKIDAGDMLVVIGPHQEIARLIGDVEQNQSDSLEAAVQKP